MILASHQPDFFPYLGYFYKMLRADVFVFSDDVHFSKGKYHNFNYLKGPGGKQRITMPISYGVKPLSLIPIAATGADRKRLLRTLQCAYSRTPHFDEVCADIAAVILDDYDSLAALNICASTMIAEKLRIGCRLILASELMPEGCKDDRIINLCQALGANTYFSGRGAAAYHQEEVYRTAGVKLMYSDYRPFTYPQKFGAFCENLSVLDYLFNCGYVLPEGWDKNE